ncbi:hypothetical protein ACQCR5_25630, partial [Ralstonia pseudosolanacearum]
MTAKSDLDLMTLYAADPRDMSSIKAWGAETFYGRFTQRLASALSAPTGEGTLYEVDLKLRPSGTKGPVAVSFAAFEDYYEREAETWELLALTRGRVAWATSPAFAAADQASHTFELRGVVPVVCRADFQSAVQEQADGVIQLGSTQEFCNAGQGYNVIVDYAAGQDA